jgi:hypothetical protein
MINFCVSQSYYLIDSGRLTFGTQPPTFLSRKDSGETCHVNRLLPPRLRRMTLATKFFGIQK